MKTIHRDPQVEEGRHNLILQNRCGNRLTLMVHEDRTELEFVYKPNARRRRDLRARNFSGRDNQTELFAAFGFPDLNAAVIEDYDYDPFVSRLRVRTPAHAENVVTLVNVVDENVFAISADRPLTLAFRPRGKFVARDGLLLETFEDRGETITAFVAFAGYEANRYRVTDDGTHVLQIYENELVLVGGEETESQAERVALELGGLSLEGLISRGERRIAGVLDHGRVALADPEWQGVLDLNRRIVLSGMDEGGACFGAINRIYYLIWNRDGSQTTSMMARSGCPDLLRVWAAFILNHPAVRRNERGELVAEWLQILGSRWTKSEDDGIFYAFLSLFTLLETTGETPLLETPEFDRLLDSLDYTIRTRFDEAEELFGSDTRGETTLRSSPMYGFDSVNGVMSVRPVGAESFGECFQKSFGLYHNVNLYNALRMAEVLIAHARPDQAGRASGYLALSERLRETLRTKYVNDAGLYHADYEHMADGTRRFIEFTDRDPNPDYWEYTWAVTMGPFFPDVEIALRSALHVREKWPTIRTYGYCPWNTLSRFLKEYRQIDDVGWRGMLSDEIAEAQLRGDKYPMRGVLTEYWRETEGWRPLPFSAGSFNWAATGLLLQSLPMGLAVRASGLASGVEDFRFRNARIDLRAEGTGDEVAGWTCNGREVRHTLQVPERALDFGRNEIVVQRGTAPTEARLYSSEAALLAVEEDGSGAVFSFRSAVPFETCWENLPVGTILTTDGEPGRESAVEELPGTRLTRARVPGGPGEITLRPCAGR